MRNLNPIQQQFKVAYDYKLHFTSSLFSVENKVLQSIFESYATTRTKIIFVVDEGVALAHPDLLEAITKYTSTYNQQFELKDILVVPGGEKAKVDEDSMQKVLNSINENGICRHSFVIAIGGGAVIDMAGYAANIAHRGVKLIRIPTTVLAQNDAAVGVKNGINYFGKKNFVGSFAIPFAIINDFDFLKTLEQRDWIAGIAEAVKVALIKDAEFFTFLEENAKAMANRDMDAMAHQIYRCAELHMQHIAQGGDPFESGSSRPLDFGHWSAHKLEQMTNYKIRHGEAVAKGIALDVLYAEKIGLITKSTLNQIHEVLLNIGFDLSLPINNSDDIDELLKGIEEFREHLGGELTITLISGIGKKHDVHEIKMDVMKAAIEQQAKAKTVTL